MNQDVLKNALEILTYSNDVKEIQAVIELMAEAIHRNHSWVPWSETVGVSRNKAINHATAAIAVLRPDLFTWPTTHQLNPRAVL